MSGSHTHDQTLSLFSLQKIGVNLKIDKQNHEVVEFRIYGNSGRFSSDLIANENYAKVSEVRVTFGEKIQSLLRQYTSWIRDYAMCERVNVKYSDNSGLGSCVYLPIVFTFSILLCSLVALLFYRIC